MSWSDRVAPYASSSETAPCTPDQAADDGFTTAQRAAPITDDLAADLFALGRAYRIWVDRWLPVFAAMPPMIRHLATRPESGLLGYSMWFGRTTIMVSYWRNPEDLRTFAADPAAPHADRWRRYVQRIGTSGDVGVWHETYVVPPGNRESVYANMPRFGLAAATGHERVGPGTATAKQRLASAH